MTDETPSDKSRLGALLFCLFLGVFGAHRFYIGSFRDKQGCRVYRWLE